LGEEVGLEFHEKENGCETGECSFTPLSNGVQSPIFGIKKAIRLVFAQRETGTHSGPWAHGNGVRGKAQKRAGSAIPPYKVKPQKAQALTGFS